MQAYDHAATVDDVGRPLFYAAPRPEQAVAHPQWQAALRTVEHALRHPGIVAVVGLPGTGKTLLLHAVAQRLRAAGRVPALLRAGSPSDVQAPDVILIDEADQLTPDMFDALVQYGRPVAMAGPPDLPHRLARLRASLTVVTLAPLRPDEAAMFLEAQLSAAGQPARLLHRDAVRMLIQRSRGVPRELQMLAGLSVFVARLTEADQVTAAHVEQAALVQHGTTPEDGAAGDDTADDTGADALPRPPAPRPPTAARSSAFSGVLPGWRTTLALGTLGVLGAAAWVVLPHEIPFLPKRPAMQAAQPAEPPPGPTAATSQMPMPPVVPVHIVVAYPPGSAEAAQRAAGLTGMLRSFGYQVAALESNAVRNESGVSYAFAEDEQTAVALARVLGLSVRELRPAALPRPGTIRVAVTPAAPRRPGPARARDGL